ncbi:Oidioi.mRNA.OKI2018_I69.chr2.g7399.t1.cds [Oikopleura dioica]|uniref:Oidioi.mRNA.OKI2018_I69.chr2.g7399.t1.cds n=1 Tax=Oikopleura dioica TaxID=34765 RepID=A0ABN7T8F3_OIKDI|nr:Oidioi.mRNA.OKI2018_I69.chr2.g7399.t1.cds [Oikopleura dioica]
MMSPGAEERCYSESRGKLIFAEKGRPVHQIVENLPRPLTHELERRTRNPGGADDQFLESTNVCHEELSFAENVDLFGKLASGAEFEERDFCLNLGLGSRRTRSATSWTSCVAFVGFSNSGEKLVVSESDSIAIFSCVTWTNEGTWCNLEGPALNVCWSHDDQKIIFAIKNKIFIASFEGIMGPDEEAREIEGFEGDVLQMSWHNQRLAVAVEGLSDTLLYSKKKKYWKVKSYSWFAKHQIPQEEWNWTIHRCLLLT